VYLVLSLPSVVVVYYALSLRRYRFLAYSILPVNPGFKVLAINPLILANFLVPVYTLRGCLRDLRFTNADMSTV
jgi:hypothetical protein